MAFISGTSGNDNITGTATNDDLRGQGGNDVIVGGDGNDYMEGNAGNDSLFGGNGHDNMRGNDGDDLVAGGDGNDFAAGGAGHDSIHGEAGNDNLQGEAGNDLIVGGGGDDYVGGGDGDDLMYGEDGGDLIEGFRGNDTAFGGNGNDHITDNPLGPWGAGSGHDAYFGGAGHDTVVGGAGNDTLNGGDDDDFIQGDGTYTANTTRSFSYVDNFDGADALLGGTQQLFGHAPGVTNVLNSPDDDHEKEFVFVQGFSTAQEASLAISPNLNSTERVTSFNTSFVLDMGSPHNSDHVDGFSINFGNMSTLPANREYENGVGTGLAIRLDPLANITEIRWNGVVICSGTTHNLESRNAGTMHVSVTSAGVVRVTYAGDTNPWLVATIPSNQWATVNQSGWQFGFAGRTGDNAGFIYMDDVSISAQIAGTSTTAATGDDLMFGDAGNDLMLDEAGNDSLFGGDGRDTLSGGAGIDALYGDAGDDILYADQASGGTSLDGADSLYGGDGNDHLFLNANANISGGFVDGGAGNDFAFGTGLGDLMLGGAGNDTLDAKSGDDSVYGDDGDDTILTDTGNDTAFGGAGNDAIQTGLGDDLAYGGAGNDWFNTDAGNDTIYGGDGDDDDMAIANEGNDLIYGGAGDDALSGGNGNDSVYGDGGEDFMTGGAGNDALFGGDDNDFVSGGIGDDLVAGGAGDDYVSGGAGGQDLVYGGAGHDTLQGGFDIDTLDGGDSNDLIYGSDPVSASNAGDMIFGGRGEDTIFASLGTAPVGGSLIDGGQGADVIYGGTGNDIIDGGADSDLIYGGEGNDFANSGDGNDTIFGGTGNDAFLNGNDGDDQVFGGQGDNQLSGGAGNDLVHSEDGRDLLYGGTGNDALESGASDDSLYGEDGDDALQSGLGNDLVYGGAGNDWINADAGDDTLYGGAGDDSDVIFNLGNDLIYAGSGNDTMGGYEGEDTVFGDAGDDDVTGGLGNDLLFGGAGDDSIVGTNSFGTDTALGGEADEVIGDLVDLAAMTTDTALTFTGSEAGTITSVGAALTFAEFEMVNLGSGADVVIGDAGNNAADAGAGNDTLNGGAGDDQLGGGAGDDLFSHNLGQNTGASDIYDGSIGTDELHLSVTAAEWANPLFQTDVAALLAHIASASPAPFLFTSTGLTVISIERFTINIDGVPTDPVNALLSLQGDTIEATEDGPAVAVNLFANDTIDDRANAVQLLGNSAYGTLLVATDLLATPQTAVLVFTPNAAAQALRAGEIVVETISYQVTDVDGDTATSTVTLTLTGANDAATITGLSVGALSEDAAAPLSGVLTVSDVDMGEAAFSVPADLTGTYGTFAFNPDTGAWSYTPNTGASALESLAQGEQVTDQFSAISRDGTAAQTITITITGTNDAPTLAAGVLAADEDGPSVTLDLTTLGDDIDAGEDGASLTYTLTTPPNAGTASISGGVLTYSAGDAFQSLAQGEEETITLTVTATDAFGAQAASTVTITVTGTNDTPTLAAGVLASVEDGPSVTLDLTTLGDDIDAGEDGSSLTYTLTNPPSAGTASIAGGVLTYSAGDAFQSLAQGDEESVTLIVTATDAFGAQATSTVTITITGTNDTPTLAAGVLASVEDGPSVTLDLTTLGDDIDAGEDGASLSYTLTTPPNAGTASIAGGVLTYSAGDAFQSLAQGDEETVTLTVTATDAFGAQATSTVTITVIGTNDAPVFTAGLATPPTVGQNPQGEAEVSGTISFTDVDLNDTHSVTAVSTSGNPVAVTIGTTASGGAIGVLSWVYTVDPQIAVGGRDTIVISLSDGNLGGTIEATLVIDIPSDSDAPDVSAPMRVFSTVGSSELPEDVNLYFTDPNLDPLTAAADPGQNYKGLAFNGTAQIVFNPDNDAYQFLTDGAQYTAFFTFLLSDGTTVQTAQIEWTITGTRAGLTGTDDADDLEADLFTSTLINGGGGDDTMIGSELEDVFAYFAAGDGFDLITNFELGQDKIGVSAAEFGGNLQAGVDPTVFNTTDYTLLDSGSTGGVFIVQDNGGRSTLYWDADGGLGDNAVELAQLDGVSSLTSDDFFIFV